jgi:hypothetical protein
MFLFSSKFRLFNVKISLNNKKEKLNKNSKTSKKISSSGDKLKDKNTSVVLVESTEEEFVDDRVSSEDIEILTEEGHDDKIDSKINEVEYREVMARFLTDNEKLVVSCIRENEGISQFDILNFLPKLTKSNLSKIISKLDNKKILKRIRVGKVNKIYLGSRFEVKSDDVKE